MAGTNNPDGFDKLLNLILPKKKPFQVERMSEEGKRQRFNIDNPLYDQRTFLGRFKHFYALTNPLNLFTTDAELDRAKDIINKYRNGDDLLDMTDDEIWKQKAIMDSAFHPKTGEKLLILGRMSAQVPMNTLLVGAMIIFQRSNTAQILFHGSNQAFNAIFNYINRSSVKPVQDSQFMLAFLCSSVVAIGSSLGLKSVFRTRGPLMRKLVPFMAITLANSANFPIMHFGELSYGTPVMTADNKELGLSKTAARQGISQIITSRLAMSVPSLVLLPIAMHALTRKGVFRKHSKIAQPLQVAFCGAIYMCFIPLGFSMYPQFHPISPSDLEPKLQEKIKALPEPPATLYYYKGL